MGKENTRESANKGEGELEREKGGESGRGRGEGSGDESVAGFTAGVGDRPAPSSVNTALISRDRRGQRRQCDVRSEERTRVTLTGHHRLQHPAATKGDKIHKALSNSEKIAHTTAT